MKDNIIKLETPCLLLDKDVLRKNIDAMQYKANTHNLRLRPHIKTHKSLDIGKLQLEAGAVGITASKTDEALKFIEKGLASVTLAYPIIDQRKLNRLLKAVKFYHTDIRFIVDSFAGIDTLNKGAGIRKTRLKVMLKIDVGLHRCGVKKNSEDLISIANAIHCNPNLNFLGILSHAGHAYGAKNPLEVSKIASQEREIMLEVKESLEKKAIMVQEVSVGSTPTVLACNDFTGITEIRPGNYVFKDRTCLKLGLVNPAEIALSVLTTVISMNEDYYIIDAGSKVLSSDIGAHGSGVNDGYGIAYPVEDYHDYKNGLIIAKLSEEHGFLLKNKVQLEIGALLRVIPNHSCPVANLADNFMLVQKQKTSLKWPIMAKGCVL